jgi:putative ABC transport system permease protein
LQARALMRPDALLSFYRRRLRVHAVQELLAGLGVAIAVALVLATTIASRSIAGSASEVVHAVVGPASLQIRARGPDGFDEGLLKRVEHLPGVEQAAPLLEATATIRSARGASGEEGKSVKVDLAGADTSLVVLDGLAHRLPIATLAPGGLGLSTTTARALGLSAGNGQGSEVTLLLRGTATPVKVSAVLGSETFGALSQAQVAVMPLADLQRLGGLHGLVSRILVQVAPGHEAEVRSELQALAGAGLAGGDRERVSGIGRRGQTGERAGLGGRGRRASGRASGIPSVEAADQDVAALKQALRPSNQASDFFAAISALLGFLFAFNALLLTVPERRQTIAELRLNGTKRSAIVQLFAFQAIVLGVLASLLGLLGGYLLSRGVFHQSTGYLAAAFTLGTHTVVGLAPLLLCLLGGVLATCLASAIPLLDLRRGRALDAVYAQAGVPGNALSGLGGGGGGRAQINLAVAAAILLAAATAMFVLAPSLALLACAVLALASVCTVPLAFVGVLGAAGSLSERYEHLSILASAVTSLRGTTLRSLALAATGAVALFGSVALGGARNDLLRGIHGFAHSYSADADIWVSNPGDNQAVSDFSDDGQAQRIARVPGVARVNVFQGGFLELGSHPPRRVWVIARPPGANRNVLASQVSGGNASTAVTRLSGGNAAADVTGLGSGNATTAVARLGSGNTTTAVTRLDSGNTNTAVTGLGRGGAAERFVPSAAYPSPPVAKRRVGGGTVGSNWIAVSKQIAEERHLGLGDRLTLPTPSGEQSFRIAATTTNLAWPPGVIFMSTAAYSRFWRTSAPSALGVQLRSGASVEDARRAIAVALGSSSGLEVATAAAREASIDTLAGEGLGQLGEISTLLLLAAILALAAAGTSAVWQRRSTLAELRLDGVRPPRLRRILLVESTLMLGAGCVTGAVAGIYGQVIIDAYLKEVTGFPVASLAASFRPLEIFALVIAVVLALVAIPGWFASRVPPMLALND